MIPSARPTLPSVVITLFTWISFCFACFWKLGKDVRTYRHKDGRATSGHDCISSPSGSKDDLKGSRLEIQRKNRWSNKMEVVHFCKKNLFFFDPPGPVRIGGHYIHTSCPYICLVCPSVRQINKKVLRRDAKTHYTTVRSGPGGSLNSQDLFGFSSTSLPTLFLSEQSHTRLELERAMLQNLSPIFCIYLRQSSFRSETDEQWHFQVV